MKSSSCIASVVAAVLFSALPASACILTENQRALVHSALPVKLPSPLIAARVEIAPDATGSQLYDTGLRVRVIRVIQGEQQGPFIRLRASVSTSCDGPFDNGRIGIVIGHPRGSENGELVLEPILAQRSDSFRLPDDYELSPYYTEPGYLERTLEERAAAVAKLNGPIDQDKPPPPHR